MRRFAAAALSAAALSATLFAATGTASAAGAGTPAPGTEFSSAQSGVLSGGHLAARAGVSAPKPSHRKHYFKATGANGGYVTGDWYWTNNTGPYKVVVEFTIHDTKRDGKAAGFALTWNYQGHSYGRWFADTKGGGTTAYFWDSFIPSVNHISGFDMVGKIRSTPNGRVFYYSSRGPSVQITK